MPENIIFGIDIAKGSVRAKISPGYAVVVLKGSEIEHHRMVSLHKFLRMAWKDKPAIIAVDNIFELASDRRELIALISRLPAHTKLVQVTGGEHLMPLTKLAKEQGLSFDRFDPNAEALVCAKLAQLGIGHEVLAFEDKAVIKVSRARSPGRGGWSQNRYRRKVHGHVRQKAREIEDTLRERSKMAGFTYSQKIIEGFGGYSKSEFNVDAPRNQLHISPGKYGDVQVTVRSIERDALVFKPIATRKRDYIIVGIDPGTTTAIAVITIGGELRMLHSSRTISIPEVIEMIAEQGRPLIIASDVFPTPNAVEKIRRAFNAVLGTPSDLLTAENKIELARPFEYSNNHERDAIAAAVSVYRKNKNRFEQIRKKLPPGVDVDDALAKVVRGQSVDSVISSLTKKEIKEPQIEAEIVREKTDEEPQRELIRRLENSIAEMRSYQEELRKELSFSKNKVKKLEEIIGKQRTQVYKDLRKEKEFQIRDKEIARLGGVISGDNKNISHLTERIQKLKAVRKLEMSGRVLPVKIIQAFTKESILHTREQFGIKKDDIILLKDASGGGTATAKLLSDYGVRAVIICNDMSHAAEEELFNLNIPVLRAKDVKIQFGTAEDFEVINLEDIEKAIEDWKTKAELRRKTAKEEWLKSLVDEYRSERRREIKGLE
jgi:predicted RNase H-like nuclease (RuvC/YqgF family)